MSIERIYFCDWRECESHVQTAGDRPPVSIITVEDDSDRPQHFCGWDCLLKFAGEKPAEEIIPMGETYS